MMHLSTNHDASAQGYDRRDPDHWIVGAESYICLNGCVGGKDKGYGEGRVGGPGDRGRIGRQDLCGGEPVGPVGLSVAGVDRRVRRCGWDPVVERREVVGALVVVVLLDVTRHGARTCPGRPGVAEDADGHGGVSGGPVVVSKVREATRVVGLIDEAKLCEMALTATASQLARMVSGYRRAAGTRIGHNRPVR